MHNQKEMRRFATAESPSFALLARLGVHRINSERVLGSAV